MTFINHESRSVWNASQLDKNLSANLLNDWWNNRNKPEPKTHDNPITKTNELDNLPTKKLFKFISKDYSQNFDSRLFSLLPDVQGEDDKEEQFANRMKKKGRRF